MVILPLITGFVEFVVLLLQLSLVLVVVVIIHLVAKVLVVAVVLFTVHIVERTIILWTVVMICMVKCGKILLLQHCFLIILRVLNRKLLSLLHLLCHLQMNLSLSHDEYNALVQHQQ